MAAPRATQFIALRNLARNASHQQVRSLHMTGPATYASPVLTKERSVLNLPRDIASLRAECKRRKIEASGSKPDLISRLNADELAHNRAFSTAAAAVAAQHPRSSTTSPELNKPTTRSFNTSRSLKAVNDTSTIDFAYFPTELTGPLMTDAYANIRVPILPDNTASPFSSTSRSSSTAHIEADEVVMKPQISTTSADSLFSIAPFSESHDGHAMHVDFHAVAETVAASVSSLKKPVEKQVNVVSQIFSDMVEDVMSSFASKQSQKKSAV